MFVDSRTTVDLHRKGLHPRVYLDGEEVERGIIYADDYAGVVVKYAEDERGRWWTFGGGSVVEVSRGKVEIKVVPRDEYICGALACVCRRKNDVRG